MNTRLRGALASLAVASALIVAGCGDAGGVEPSGTPDASAPAAAVATPSAPAPTGPLNQGDQVTPGPKTPKAVVAALKADRPMVIAFLYGQAADDVSVRRALGEVRRNPEMKGVAFFAYDVSVKGPFGDLPTRLGVTETPSVVVLGRGGTVVNIWTGLVDAEMITQSAQAAKDAGPRG